MIHGTILPSSAVADLITDQVHQLVVPALGWVDLRVLDFEGAPVPQWSCELRVASRVEVAPTDDEGRVSFKALVDV
ncbi:MAG: hypothetical protein K0V04_38315, partial [Deltaproteobacteria bacterium]|nr:hypothetical protein [Deltaproteobacteria bacterium]